MKRLLFLVVFSMLLVSCQKDELIKHLETGLVNYKKTRPVDEKLIDGIALEKFAIFKTGDETYSLVLKLNDNVEKHEIDKYQVAIEAILDDHNKLLRDYEAEHNKKGFNFKSDLKVINNHSYLINIIETKIKRFESVDIWLFFLENDAYKSAGGNRVQIRNLGL